MTATTHIAHVTITIDDDKPIELAIETSGDLMTVRRVGRGETSPALAQESIRLKTEQEVRVGDEYIGDATRTVLVEVAR